MKKNKKLQLNDLNFDEIKVGDSFSFDKFIDNAMVDSFAELTHDYNPLHTDHNYAKNTEFGGRIAHGMLIGSFFSTLVGMLCPGKKCLYLSQDLSFKNPLRPDSRVTVMGVITNKSDAIKVIEIETIIKNNKGSVIVSGNAKVKVREK
jgi:3-hydroxybutyryl-CoA dehydratase|tara:strand:- start:34 stop:477 length:444 start_codon:yes stop_codon:yes gene_type:complete